MEPGVGTTLGSTRTNLACKLAVPERFPVGVVDMDGVIVTLVYPLLPPSRIFVAAPPPDGVAASSIPTLPAGNGPFNFRLPVDLSMFGLFGLKAIDTVSLLHVEASPEIVSVNGTGVEPAAGTSVGCKEPKSTVLNPCSSPSIRQVLVPMLPVNVICPEFVAAALDWLAITHVAIIIDTFTIFFMKNSFLWMTGI